MREVAIMICIMLCESCGTPRGDTSSTGPTLVLESLDARATDAEDAKAIRRPKVVAYTFEGWAKHLGVHHDIFFLASMGCARLLNCGWEIGIPSECAAEIVRVWCTGYSCDEPIFADPNNIGDDECAIDSHDPSACGSLGEPLQCEFLQSRGLELRLTDGAPPGGWPIYPDEPPLHPWPGGAQSQSLPRSQDAPR